MSHKQDKSTSEYQRRSKNMFTTRHSNFCDWILSETPQNGILRWVRSEKCHDFIAANETQSTVVAQT